MKPFRSLIRISLALAASIYGSATSGCVAAVKPDAAESRPPFWWLPKHDRGRDVPRPAHRYSKVRGIKLKANRAQRAQRARLAEAFAFMR